MKKNIVCMIVILSFCFIVSGCDVFRKDPQPELTLEPIPKNATIELTMYTGLRNVTDSNRQKMITDIVDQLNALSRSSLGITVRMVYSDSPLFEPRWENDVPDINIVNGLFSIGLIPNAQEYRPYFPNNRLFSYYSKGHIDDISSYINEKTPHISLFYDMYPAFLKASGLEGKHLGVVIPDSNTDWFPVLIVKKSIADQYINYEVTDYDMAYDLCKEISINKKDDTNKTYVASGNILNWVIRKEGYASFLSQISYLYVIKSDDPDQQIRPIYETDLWDRLMTEKQVILDYDIKTNQEQLLRDFPNNTVDAALFTGLSLLEDLVDSHPKLMDEYVIYPLYENYEMNTAFKYFIVSEQCGEKQRAFQYIDWLLSNEEARKLIGYGIEGVNYTYDKNERTIHLEQEADRLSLVPIGTGVNFMTKGFSILGDIGEVTYIKDKILRNYKAGLMSEYMGINEYAKAFEGLYKRNEDTIMAQYTLCRFPVFNFEKMRSDQIIPCFFDEYVTAEYLKEFIEKIKLAHDPVFIRDMQNMSKYYKEINKAKEY